VTIHVGWVLIFLIVLGALYFYRHRPTPTQ
jgi:hypothetical protein